MLRFFKDDALTIPVTEVNPLWVLSPLEGGIKHLSAWLADDYWIPVSQLAAPGSLSLFLVDTSAIPSSGTLWIGGVAITYTSKTRTGVSGIPATDVGSIGLPIPAGARAYPQITYTGLTNLTITCSDPRTALKLPEMSRYGIQGASQIFSFISGDTLDVNGNPQALAQVDLEITVPRGSEGLSAWRLETSELSTPVIDSFSAYANGSTYQFDQVLHQRARIFPNQRKLEATTPGFIYGEYRWRDRNTSNAHVLVPSQWDLDVPAIGTEKFISGIGHAADLQVIQLEKSTTDSNPHSIYARVQTGDYFVGHERFHLPADGAVIDVLPAAPGTYSLSKKLRPQVPVFVGSMRLDQENRYRIGTSFRYGGRTLQGVPAVDYPQFTIGRDRQSITVNQGLSLDTVFLGTGSATDRKKFSIPYWPIGRVLEVYLGPFGLDDKRNVKSWSYDAKASEITIFFPDNLEVDGRDVYIRCTAGIAVVYEPDDAQTSVLLESADLNPAFAGISHGFLYLEHRTHRSKEIDLYCDKPRILLPTAYTLASGAVINSSLPNELLFNDLGGNANSSRTIVFGPVFYENDFAMLLAVALSDTQGEKIPNVRLDLIVDADFRGLLNYQDPSTTTVSVTTGGDGTAAFLYTPPDIYGLYMPAGQASGTLLTLSEPVPFRQLYDPSNGWITRLYSVTNDDGFFGKVGADVSVGEIPYTETGTAGTASFRSNGRRFAWKKGAGAVQPIIAYDAGGHRHDEDAFDGLVVSVRYIDNVPTGANISAYFFAYAGRILIQARAADSGILSNQILLLLESPPDVIDETGVAGFLRPDSPDIDPHTDGRLDVNRLGGAPILPKNVHTSRF